ncbi:DIL domain-containing protein [Phellopilus nigrolimitatus]|nr:DIL domain-containing protein [Phellopilus nigrolimitatus]
MPPSQTVDFVLEPDLHPLYPSPSDVARMLSTSSGLTPTQKATLVTHCMTRACVFADLSFLQYILHDPQAHVALDLNYQDEDGLVYASVIILGFGAESEREVEREECVRLLIAEGADVNIPDRAGWTPLHHAALLAPPTLISHLLTHGCSPLSVTLKNMTALDIVTAYSVIPGREDVALFLEEAMRGDGWQSSRMAIQRRCFSQKLKQNGKRQTEREAIKKILDLNSQWWRSNELFPSACETSDDEADDEDENEKIYTPPLDYSSMLVFSPASLPGIFDSLITNFRPSTRNADPANALYMLARFACLTCDHTWLEELVMGATDVIEDAAFNHPDDLTYTVFWLYNCTSWLHFMRCDSAIRETCELLGSFDLIEEVINTVYVLIIRVAERRIDKLIDTALLDFSPADSELDAVQFESEWSLFRSPFASKKRAVSQNLTPSATSTSFKMARPGSPVPSSRPTSPVQQQNASVPQSKKFSSLRQSITRARGASPGSLQALFVEDPLPVQSSQELIVFLSALHTLLTDSGINPAIITQLWSQVMYWTSSEVFNRILTRKRYLCRSRALQIGMNLSIVEEWIGDVGLPRGVESHFASTRELLLWLQCLSSMDDFPNLIATIQTMRYLNPLQMRRAVRDYRYEVNESRMSDDCSQYLAQLQKDWERQRVRLGVEALRKEITDRDKDYDDDSLSSEAQEANGSSPYAKSFSTRSIDESSQTQSSVDLLFDKTLNQTEWTPQQPPEVLGELLESRYMLPLLLPSDPRMLGAVPGKKPEPERTPNLNASSIHRIANGNARSHSRTSNRRVLDWVMKGKRMRYVRVELLDWLDGTAESGRWTRRADSDDQDEEVTEGGMHNSDSSSSPSDGEPEMRHNHVRLTRLARAPSSRSKQGRSGTG